MKARSEKKRAELADRRRRMWLLLACLGASALLLAAAWAQPPRSSGDFWVALAAGRDICEGKLARPDDWAFTTDGRVWTNQNWLSHLLIYAVWQAGGEAGELALKAVLLAGGAAFIALAARGRGVSWPVAVLVAGAALVAGRTYVNLRPNLMTLLLTPLLVALLAATRRNVHWIWPAAAVVGLWANLHGGFIFGLAVMALWVVCRIVAEAVRARRVPPPRTWWPLVAGVLVAALLAALANPFGVVNLTHPLTVAGRSEWRRITEWQPLFSGRAVAYGSTWEFAVAVGAVVALSVWRLGRHTRRKKSFTARPAEAPAVPVAFDVLLAVGVLFMAVSARRFIPLAVIVLAPMIAEGLQKLLRPDKWSWPTLLAAGALVAPVLVFGKGILRPYHWDNPAYPRQTILQRMHGQQHFPAGAADFLAAHGAGGRLFHAWEWEGFLRWRLGGRVKLFVGGRAQQVHDLHTDRLRRQILTQPDPAARLAELDVHLAVVPVSERTVAFIGNLFAAPGGQWAFVYRDDCSAVLADAGSAETRDLVAKVARGDAPGYPDAATAALSRALCLASPVVGPDGLNLAQASAETLIEVLQRANRLRPTVVGYQMLEDLAASGKMPPARLLDYLEAEAKRLAAIDTDRPEGVKVLECRQMVARILSRLYRQFGRDTEAGAQQKTAEKLTARIDSLMETWR